MSNRAEDNWKRRAEKAEIRVAELEAQLAVAHKLHGYARIEELSARVAELEGAVVDCVIELAGLVNPEYGPLVRARAVLAHGSAER